MQNMKRPLASRSLHYHGAAGASKLFLVYSEHCLAILVIPYLEGPLDQQFSKAEGYAKFQGIDFEFTLALLFLNSFSLVSCAGYALNVNQKERKNYFKNIFTILKPPCSSIQ